MAGRCSSYDVANPWYVENWLRDHADLVDSEVVLAWIERLCDDPSAIESERMLGALRLVGYRTAFIDDVDVDVVYVAVDPTCEVYFHKLTHLSEIGDKGPGLP